MGHRQREKERERMSEHAALEIHAANTAPVPLPPPLRPACLRLFSSQRLPALRRFHGFFSFSAFCNGWTPKRLATGESLKSV